MSGLYNERYPTIEAGDPCPCCGDPIADDDFQHVEGMDFAPLDMGGHQEMCGWDRDQYFRIIIDEHKRFDAGWIDQRGSMASCEQCGLLFFENPDVIYEDRCPECIAKTADHEDQGHVWCDHCDTWIANATHDANGEVSGTLHWNQRDRKWQLDPLSLTVTTRKTDKPRWED
jgi:hypothetical protein